MGEWNRERVEILNSVGINIEPLGERDGMKTLTVGCDILQKMNIPYWIASGTLLGLHRDGKLMPHDTDIDVEVVYKEAHKVVWEFTKNGFEVIRGVNYPIVGLPMQRAFRDLRNEQIIFDIYFYHPEGDNLINYNDHGKLVLPKKLVYPIIDQKPWDVEGYLEWRYGPDWKVPKGSKEDWGKDTKCLQ